MLQELETSAPEAGERVLRFSSDPSHSTGAKGVVSSSDYLRFPLVSLGFLFVVRSTIPAPGLELTIYMMRKLRSEEDINEATALILLSGRRVIRLA